MTHAEHTPASPKQPLAPDIRRMDERSARAWTEAMAVRPLGSGRYAVESQSGATYEVDLAAGDCSCPDHSIRGERCKHLRRVAIEVNRGLTPPPGRVVGECRVCGREAFVTEAAPRLCSDCGLSPGDVVFDRETDATVVVAAVTDRRADETAIRGEDGTVADYPSNADYLDDDPVVEVVYPFSHPRRDLEDLPRYSFPLSRLERRGQRRLTDDWR